MAEFSTTSERATSERSFLQNSQTETSNVSQTGSSRNEADNARLIFQQSFYAQQTSPPRSGSSTPFNAPRGRYPSRGGYYSPPMSPGGRSSYSTGREGCLYYVKMTAFAKLSRYCRRLAHFRHMDFEFAAWQMVYLLVAPQKVYRNFMYRKRTKDQWARDDPAFLVLLSLALAVSSIGYALILGLGFVSFIKFLLWVVFVDCIGTGLVVATLLWMLATWVLRRGRGEEDVEWGFCFDVHLNAFFPALVLLHVIMPALYSLLINHPYFLSRLFGNTIWFVALTYYLYITFLGYTALPMLKHTHVLLYPFSFLFILYVTTVTVGWNISSSVMSFYHFRAT